MSRVKAQQECLVVDQVSLDPEDGGSRDDRIKRESFSEPRNIEPT